MNYMPNPLGIWEIAVLSLLRQSPMHPYLMQGLLRARHKDKILALKHGSLYHAIRRLNRLNLIRVSATGRDGRRPERTTYRITPEGRKQLLASLRQIISAPRRESSEFMAAMSFLVHLSPAESRPRLEERSKSLAREIEQTAEVMKTVSLRVPRIHLIENEYLLAMLRAELGWTLGLIADIRSGKLDWNTQEILKKARTEARDPNLEP